MRLTAGIWTICVDENKADEDKYPNWVTFRFIRRRKDCYDLERKSNADGNGQIWEQCGNIEFGSLHLYTFHKQPNGGMFTEARDTLTLMVGTVMARYFDLRFSKALAVNFPNSRVWKPRGNKTAAPSLLRKVVRNKNRNAMREHVARIDMGKEMARRIYHAKVSNVD